MKGRLPDMVIMMALGSEVVSPPNPCIEAVYMSALRSGKTPSMMCPFPRLSRCRGERLSPISLKVGVLVFVATNLLVICMGEFPNPALDTIAHPNGHTTKCFWLGPTAPWLGGWELLELA